MSATTQMVSIYGLVDPTTNQLRYVGKSTHPTKRLREHLGKRALRARTHLTSWLRSLLAQGREPEVVILEDVSADDWQDDEKFWIAYMKFLGCRLTNGTQGGEGGLLMPAARAKQAAALRGRKVKRSADHLAKIVECNKRRASDPAWLRKISAAAKARVRRDPDHMRRVSRLGSLAALAAGPYSRECAVCSKEFVSKTKPGKFCGPKCRGFDFRERHREVA